MTFVEEVADQLNLRWAWEKVWREAARGDIWFDQVELAQFELQLENNLHDIADDFLNRRYRMKPLRPLPFPKHDKKDGAPQVRQVFQVTVRDQVAWMAVVNIVGPHVDSKMPTWSYGNRLYRSIWIEEDKRNGQKPIKVRKIGRYRHATGRLYLSFGQSWPLFRRHVYLATRAMTQDKKHSDLDTHTAEEQDLQERLAEEHRCPFVIPEYWQNRRPQNDEPELYWCSIDLEKFYPTMKLRVVQDNIVGELPNEWRDDASRLIESMLKFQLDLQHWPDNDELKKINIKKGQKRYMHIPTGLYVAGFLANAGLLKADREVAKRLSSSGCRIAHFRFVDDHIFLAFDFNELEKWVNDYASLLSNAGTGSKVNLAKVEPEEFANYSKAASKGKRNDDLRAKAMKKCRLDPQFPSPLMTKTLAVVSNIARTDFNLLEREELNALTDQLEHLLLVDLPEEEIPEKTRLSFAAMRLTRIAECRLANKTAMAASACSHDTNQEQKKQEAARLFTSDNDAKTKMSEPAERNDLQAREVGRAFQLLRKVLRDSPDKIRLWTRALLMCRRTGVKGLQDLWDDINRLDRSGKNPLAAQYLRANMLVLLGNQVLVASRIMQDEGAAHWRWQASRDFLEDAISMKIKEPNDDDRLFLRMSWRQFCFGIYCAHLVLQEKSCSKKIDGQPIDIIFPEGILEIGRRCLTADILGHSPAQWTWWASRMTLRDLTPKATWFVKKLGDMLKPSPEASSFWRFFPLDVPDHFLKEIEQSKEQQMPSETLSGWWYDALRHNPEVITSFKNIGRRRMINRVVHLLSEQRKGRISLYDWCNYLRNLPNGGSTDPRCGEWTALEIVRQIAMLIEGRGEEIGVKYIKRVSKGKENPLCIHPANFNIPKKWLDDHLWRNKAEPTWDEWRNCVCNQHKAEESCSVLFIPKSDRIIDNRYTPLNNQNELFSSINPVRGLGLLLYGLLKKSFDLPSLWNGPGHADVLGLLPRLLLADMTCSSWTLGFMQSCLQPRVTENIYMKRKRGNLAYHADNDTRHDPYILLSARDVKLALETCQKGLTGCQLSTFQHKARQLTPVSIRQLTEPEWNKVFGGENANE